MAPSQAPASADVNQIDSGVTPVNHAANAKEKSITGKAAAGVLIPLLFICLCVAAWFEMQCAKGNVKRNGGARQWTSACPSSLQKAHKPPSGILPFLEVGDATLLSHLAPFVLLASTLRIAMTQGTQQGLGLHATCSFALEWNSAALSSTERVSRVSFAADTCTSRVSFIADPRPPGESYWMGTFHSAYIPPVPALPSDDVSDDGSGSLSPRETQGPLTLTPEDIRAMINGNRSVPPFELDPGFGCLTVLWASP